MEKNFKKVYESYVELRGYLKTTFFQTGVALALFVWLFCPFIDAVSLNKGTIYQRITQPEIHDVFALSVISVIIVIFSFIGSVLLIRSRQADAALHVASEE